MVMIAASLHTPHANANVLCVGEDGHIEVEAASGPVCATEEIPVSREHFYDDSNSSFAWSSAGLDHCGECTDYALIAHHDIRWLGTRIQGVDVSVPVTAIAWTETPLADGTSRLCNCTPISPLSLSLAFKRSVSLQR